MSFDDQKANAAFVACEKFPFDLLCDESRSVGVAYHACEDASAKSARRISYLIDAHGFISHVFDKVNPAQHPDEVLAALDASGGR